MQTPKNSFNLTWQISGVLIALATLYLTYISLGEEVKKSIPKETFYYAYGAIVLFFVIQVFKLKIAKALYRIKLFLKRQSKSHIIINKRYFRLGILDNTGKRVNIYEETYFTKIRSSASYSSELGVKGLIDPLNIRTLNCSYTTNDNGNIRFYFLKDFQIQNGVKSRNTTFYSYSVDALETFDENTEFWVFPVVNALNELEIKVIFPLDRKPTKANIYISRDRYSLTEMDWDQQIQYDYFNEVPFVSTALGVCAKARLFNLELGRYYKLQWEW